MAMDSKIKATKESLANASQIILTDVDYMGSKYTASYKDAVFTVWYSAGKPSMERLIKMLPNPAEFGIAIGYPSENTLNVWVKDYKERAIGLDEEVSRRLADRLIAEKVKMLDAHSVIAAEMQQMSLQYLRENKDKLSPNAAVRMLVEGVRIERESKGIPRTLEKLADKSDEDLLQQIEDLLLRSPIQTTQLEDSE